MRSLRSRLGLVFTTATVALVLGAAVALVVAQWRSETARLPETVDLAAFEAAEAVGTTSPSLEPGALDGVGGAGSFAIVAGADGYRAVEQGEVTPEIRFLVDEVVLTDFLVFDTSLSFRFEAGDSLTTVIAESIAADLEQITAEGIFDEFAPGDLFEQDLIEQDLVEQGLIEQGLIEQGAFDDGAFEEGVFLDGEELDLTDPEVWEQLVGVEVEAAGLDDQITETALVITAVPCEESSACSVMVVGSHEESLGSYAGRTWWALVLPPLVAGLLALAGSWWLVGRSLRPVARMTSELDSITATDLERRVPVPETGDELEDLGSSMNATISRLQSTVTANERFVADAAHELRSPITGVMAALQVEAGRNPDGLVGDSVGELERASRLIDDLLMLARREGGQTRRTDVDLDDVVRGATAVLQTRFPDIEMSTDLDVARLDGDADALNRLVTNVVENACLHGNGRVEVAVHTEVGADGRSSHAVVTVTDDGPGVPAADRARVFERFARLDESRARSTGGSGLGLAIVAEIAADHGGSVEIDDSVLGGACFRVRLPLSR